MLVNCQNDAEIGKAIALGMKQAGIYLGLNKLVLAAMATTSEMRARCAWRSTQGQQEPQGAEVLAPARHRAWRAG